MTTIDQQLMVYATNFESVTDRKGTSGSIEWDSLVETMQNPVELPTKAQCPLIKLALLGNQPSPNGSLRHDANVVEVFGVEGDHDAGTMTPAEAASRLSAVGIMGVVYTTPSHRPEKPRWRVLVPLSTAFPPAERTRFAGIVNAVLNGALAPESFKLSQPFYYGRVQGVPYECIPVQGVPLDLADHSHEPLYPVSTSRGGLPQGPDDPTGFDCQATMDRALASMSGETMDELREAIMIIPADDVHMWVRVGEALATLKGTPWAKDAWQLFDEWSSTAPNKYNPSDCRRTWEGFRPSRTTFKAVFKIAAEHGWVNPRKGKPRVAAIPGAGQSERPGGVRLVPASEVRAEDVAWLWEGWLAKESLQLLTGIPGQGKTNLALMFAATVSTGGVWPDGTKAKQGNVIIWTGEDGLAQTLVPRLTAAGADMSRVHFVIYAHEDGQEGYFDPAKHMIALQAAIESLEGGAELLIMDPLIAVVAGDMNKANETRQGLAPLVNLAKATGVAVLGITHKRKGSQGSLAQERVLGSQAFVAVARLVMDTAAERAAQGAKVRRVLVRTKSNLGPIDGGYEYALDSVQVPGLRNTAPAVKWGKALQGTAEVILATVESEATDDSSPGSAARKFLRELLNGAPLPAQQVWAEGRAAGFSQDQLRRAGEALNVHHDPRRTEEGKRYWAWRLPGPPQPSGGSEFSDMIDEKMPDPLS